MWLGNPKEFIHLGVFDSYYMQWGGVDVSMLLCYSLLIGESKGIPA